MTSELRRETDEPQIRSQDLTAPDLQNVNTLMTNILTANRIPAAKVVDHVNEMRARALEMSKWVCIRLFEWVVIWIAQHPCYDRILLKLKSDKSATMLDLGCFISQETRQLIYDGVDSQKLAALDLEKKFFDFGYDFFNDRQTNMTHFYAADLQDLQTLPQGCLQAFDFIWACRFFHIWNRHDQLQAAENVTRMLKVKPGAILFGQHLGHPVAIERKVGTREMFLHSHESWIKMWEEVARRTSTTWKIQTWYSEVFDEVVKRLMAKDMVLMLFSVERVDSEAGHIEDLGNSTIKLQGRPEGP